MAKKKKKSKEKKKSKGKDKEEDFKHRVRLGETVLEGDKDVIRALTQIKGMGRQVSNSLVRVLDVDKRRKLGSLSESEIGKIEDKIENLNQSLPHWMLNRKKDYETGKDIHLTGTDLQMTHRDDIKRMRKIKSYRGIRHSAGLPVRGQRTRTSFRKGTTIGVSRKKALRREAEKKKKERE